MKILKFMAAIAFAVSLAGCGNGSNSSSGADLTTSEPAVQTTSVTYEAIGSWSAEQVRIMYTKLGAFLPDPAKPIEAFDTYEEDNYYHAFIKVTGSIVTTTYATKLTSDDFVYVKDYVDSYNYSCKLYRKASLINGHRVHVEISGDSSSFYIFAYAFLEDNGTTISAWDSQLVSSINTIFGITLPVAAVTDNYQFAIDQAGSQIMIYDYCKGKDTFDAYKTVLASLGTVATYSDDLYYVNLGGGYFCVDVDWMFGYFCISIYFYS